MINLKDPIALGAVLRIPDYKFLQAYHNLNVNSDYYSSATDLEINESIDNNISRSYIHDLNSVNIKNAIIGPSTKAGSKNIIQERVAKVSSYFDNQITLSSALGMDISENDNILIAQQPEGWDVADNKTATTNTCATVRTPKTKVSKHANSLILNFNTIKYLYLPITEVNTVSLNNFYRFSMHYRASGAMTITPFVDFYTNSGVYINFELYNTIVLNVVDTEESEFRFLDIAIPWGALCGIIPPTAQRMRVGFLLYPTGSAILEVAYPVIESSFGYLSSSIGAYMILPDSPSSIQFEKKSSTNTEQSNRNMAIPFDSSKLFMSHIGRDLFSINLNYEMIDAVYVQQLKNIEHLNLMGYPIAIRPNHNNLPPVMIGNIKVEDSLVHYDYRKSNINIIFEETE